MVVGAVLCAIRYLFELDQWTDGKPTRNPCRRSTTGQKVCGECTRVVQRDFVGDAVDLGVKTGAGPRICTTEWIACGGAGCWWVRVMSTLRHVESL